MVAAEGAIEGVLGRGADLAGDATLPINNASTAVFAGPLDGLEADQEDIFLDPNAQAMAATWWSDPKTFELAFSGV